jgi:CubicO group peptidase (beta-lactamase class C family)
MFMRLVSSAKSFCGIRFAAFFGVVCAISASTPVLAQNDLPPIAAPTTSIAVSSLPVIRSESQQVTDYARGLVDGMATQLGVSGFLVVVSQDRIDLAEGIGLVLDGLDADRPVAIGSMADLFAIVSSMQLIQRAMVLPDEDIANALGEPEARGVTFGDLLTLDAPGLGEIIPQVIVNLAATSYPDWVEQEIFLPLAMTNSRYDPDVGFLVSPRDMGRFLMALINSGTVDGGTILLPPTIELMMRRHRAIHEALPGWAYGFAEMQRNGQRALQRDGTGVFEESRVVINPETQTAYFVAVAPAAGPAFWRVLDNMLFDRLSPPGDGVTSAASGPPPDAQDAAAVSGSYRLAGPTGAALFVMRGPETIRVEAEGGLLYLHDGAQTTFIPAPGGIWQTEDGETQAAFAAGILQIGEFAYSRVTPILGAGVYLALMGAFSFLALTFAVGGYFVPSIAGHEPKRGRQLAFGLAGLTAILALLAGALHATV